MTKQEEHEKRWEFFQQLWKNLPKNKYCQSCGVKIYGENKPLYWDHLLERNKYPNLQYEKDNMFFCCGDCHASKTNGWPKPKHKEAIEKAKQQFLNQ